MDKSRKFLQNLQPSTNSISKGDSNMALESKITETVKKILTPGKENTVTLRRSKRRNAVAKVVNNTVAAKGNHTSSLSMAKTGKTKSIQKVKGCSVAAKKTDQNSYQSKLSFSHVPSKSSHEFSNTDVKLKVNAKQTSDETVEAEDSSVFPENTVTSSILEGTLKCPEWKVPASDYNMTVFSESGDPNFLTDEEPSLQYWMDLAEERRIALEKVLHQNELLRDSNEVLETENSQLKSAVKDAEQLALIVRGIIE